MKLDREHIKHEIDAAAELLKDATDHISDKGHEVAEKASEKSMELTLRIGDALIAVGQKLKDSTKESSVAERREIADSTQ